MAWLVALGVQGLPEQQKRKWRDGSLESDLPMKELKELFNVNHFIVSQANPHIAPLLRIKEACRTLGGQWGAKVGTGRRASEGVQSCLIKQARHFQGAILLACLQDPLSNQRCSYSTRLKVQIACENSKAHQDE